jgi:hypothetical protein
MSMTIDVASIPDDTIDAAIRVLRDHPNLSRAGMRAAIAEVAPAIARAAVEADRLAIAARMAERGGSGALIAHDTFTAVCREVDQAAGKVAEPASRRVEVVHLGICFPTDSRPWCGAGQDGDLVTKDVREATCVACIRRRFVGSPTTGGPNAGPATHEARPESEATTEAQAMAATTGPEASEARPGVQPEATVAGVHGLSGNLVEEVARVMWPGFEVVGNETREARRRGARAAIPIVERDVARRMLGPAAEEAGKDALHRASVDHAEEVIRAAVSAALGAGVESAVAHFPSHEDRTVAVCGARGTMAAIGSGDCDEVSCVTCLRLIVVARTRLKSERTEELNRTAADLRKAVADRDAWKARAEEAERDARDFAAQMADGLPPMDAPVHAREVHHAIAAQAKYPHAQHFEFDRMFCALDDFRKGRAPAVAAGSDATRPAIDAAVTDEDVEALTATYHAVFLRLMNVEPGVNTDPVGARKAGMRAALTAFVARRAPAVSLSGLDREALGREVRRVWVDFARSQPNPKPHHLAPWEELDEPNKEVDRIIGERLATLGAEAAFASMQRILVADNCDDADRFIHAARSALRVAPPVDHEAARRDLTAALGKQNLEVARITRALADEKAAREEAEASLDEVRGNGGVLSEDDCVNIAMLYWGASPETHRPRPMGSQAFNTARRAAYDQRMRDVAVLQTLAARFRSERPEDGGAYEAGKLDGVNEALIDLVDGVEPDAKTGKSAYDEWHLTLAAKVRAEAERDALAARLERCKPLVEATAYYKRHTGYPSQEVIEDAMSAIAPAPDAPAAPAVDPRVSLTIGRGPHHEVVFHLPKSLPVEDLRQALQAAADAYSGGFATPAAPAVEPKPWPPFPEPEDGEEVSEHMRRVSDHVRDVLDLLRRESARGGGK